MLRKILILTLVFYLLALLQTSFLVPNFILIAVILVNLFEKPRYYSGIFSAFAGGFFLDIFSSCLIGFHILILLAISFFIKIVLRKYVGSPLR